MKDTSSTTENIITNQEENVMNEEVLEKKEQLIDDIKSWYEDSYMIIRDMEQSHYEKPWIISEARKLTANAQGGDDKRDVNCTAIMEGIIQYIEAQPEEYFERAWYDEWICVDELYDHVNEDIYRFGLYKG